MNRKTGCFISLLLVLVFAHAGRAAAAPEVIAVSDVHGDFDALTATLERAGVVDAQGRWCGGDRHLVVTGDLLDRGAHSRQAMDLMMRLEGEAATAGGAVHMLLGNHEVMNLVGDLRYVHPGEYAAFAADEDPAERQEWLQAWSAQRATGVPDEQRGRLFDERFPPGFFAHRRAFRADGKYGRWLLERRFVAVLNETVFVHGGLSPAIADAGIDALNQRLAADLRESVRLLAQLTDDGVLLPTDQVEDLDAVLAAASGPDAARLVELGASDLHSSLGPLWYRGNVYCPAPEETTRLDRALRQVDARRIVVGHTPTDARAVQTRLGGRVVEIDTGMNTDYYGGSGHALSVANGRLEVYGEEGEVPDRMVEQPETIGELDELLVVELLESGDVEIVEDPAGAAGTVRVRVSAGEHSIDAEFLRRAARGVYPDVAAYRLDRLLGLNRVPAAVVREVNGRDGSLRYLPAHVADEAERVAAGRGAGAWCPLDVQWNAMFVFDALIHNPRRTPQSMLYANAGWQLLLTGHEAAFRRDRKLPAWLDNVEYAVGNGWAEALDAIGDAALETQFADVLDARRVRALAERRDGLLAEADRVYSNAIEKAAAAR